MSNNKTIQEMFDNQFSKDTNYKKILSKLEGGIYMKNKILKFSLVPICLILIICGIVLFKPDTDVPNVIKVADNDNMEIYINELKNVSMAKLDADVQMQEEINIVKEHEPLKNVKIPSDLQLSESFLIYTRKDNQTTQYDILHDYVLVYNKIVNNLQEKKIIVAFSKDFEPLRDYYIDTGNLSVSKINDIKVTIAAYNDMYIATFSCNNLNFDIETIGITQEEFISLIKSLIK
jgi:hypothetical protein